MGKYSLYYTPSYNAYRVGHKQYEQQIFSTWYPTKVNLYIVHKMELILIKKNAQKQGR